MKVPYLTKKHIEALAVELAKDKIFYNSEIMWQEKHARLKDYCRQANDNFNENKFDEIILDTVNKKLLKMKLNIQLENLTQYIKQGGSMDYLTITLIIIVGFLVLAYYRNQVFNNPCINKGGLMTYT